MVVFRCIHYSVQSAMTYFACKVTVEDAEAFKPGQAYVVGTATIHRHLLLMRLHMPVHDLRWQPNPSSNIVICPEHHYRQARLSTFRFDLNHCNKVMVTTVICSCCNAKVKESFCTCTICCGHKAMLQVWSLIRRCQWPCPWSSQTTVISYRKVSEGLKSWLTLR